MVDGKLITKKYMGYMSDDIYVYMYIYIYILFFSGWTWSDLFLQAEGLFAYMSS